MRGAKEGDAGGGAWRGIQVDLGGWLWGGREVGAGGSVGGRTCSSKGIAATVYTPRAEECATSDIYSQEPKVYKEATG